MDKVNVYEEPDGTYVQTVGAGVTRWKGTREALHTLLARLGYKRVMKQQDSKIGGEYAALGQPRD
jgi:hypothetical protein